MVRRRPRRTIQTSAQVVAVLTLVLALAGCGGLAAPPPAGTEEPQVASPPPANSARPTPPATAVHCEDGRLTLGDLLKIETEWESGVAAATEQARGWQADARLIQLRISCQPLESGFRWQGTFYSDSAQSYFFSDTGQTEPAEDDPASIPTLPLEGISFQQLHLTLARAGHADTDTFNPTSGVTIRLNTPSEPFGPPEIPESVVYYVAVELQGEVRDLFVSQTDWTIRSYRDST
jgi:hypothetical protein